MIALSGRDDMTPRDLAEIVRVKQLNDWDHTAMLAACISNMFAKRPRGMKDFHPYRKAAARTSGQEQLAHFRELFRKDTSNG